ncbi:MAG TPA: family 16 glycoside hydrolase [Planctomycetota bacterium]|nr:family 16 glycoside hydrolase [Planctomycetota bacterium]
MRLLLSVVLASALGCAGGGAASASQPAESDGFVPLFNGHDLTGWVRVNCAPDTFRASDGLIVTTGKPTGVLRTERMYENYIAEFDWMHLKKGGNSGFFIHSGAMPVQGQPFTKGHEIQVLDGDDPKGQWTGHGDVFSIHGATFVPDRPHPAGWMRCLPSEKRAHPAGQWNHYKVTVNDGSVKLEVNGKEVSGGTKCNPRKGYICLESEGAPCHFRNLLLKELPSTNPPPEEIAEEYQGFQTLYTGLDLHGWTGGDGWKSSDWVLEGASTAGVLRTERAFENFIFVFDWKSAKDGNLELRIGDLLPLSLNAEVKPGTWDRIIVAVQGEQRSVTQNGKKTTETIPKAASPRTIGLKATGEKVQFANLFLCELK